MTSNLLRLRLQSIGLVRTPTPLINKHVLKGVDDKLGLFQNPFSMKITRNYVRSLPKTMNSVGIDTHKRFKPEQLKTRKMKKMKEEFDGEYESCDHGAICIFIGRLEKKVAKGLSGNRFDYFFEFNRDPKMEEELEKIVPQSTQEVFEFLRDNAASVDTPLTLEGLQYLKKYRVTEEEINVIWKLSQKYLQGPKRNPYFD